MAESKFNKKFRAELEKRGFCFYRIESHGTCPGLPDNHYIMDGPYSTSGWIEMKEENQIPRKVQYQPQQAHWLWGYAKKGGTAWTAIHIAERNAVMMVPGRNSLLAAVDLASAQPVMFQLDKAAGWDLVAALLQNRLS